MGTFTQVHMNLYRLAFCMFVCCWSLAMLGLQSQQPATSGSSSGQRLFQAHCSVCHGLKGEGGKGANLAAPRLVHASTKETLIKVIRDGIPGTEMPENEL